MTSGVCPYCGMELVRARPFDVRPYLLEVETAPPVVRAGETTTLRFRTYRPGTDVPVTAFYWGPRQAMASVRHQPGPRFLPAPSSGHGCRRYVVDRRDAAATRLLRADIGLLSQRGLCAAAGTSAGHCGLRSGSHGWPRSSRSETYPLSKTAENLAATIDFDPPRFVAGLTCRVNFHVRDSKTGAPVTDLQTYLGAFGHAFVMSEDRVDYVHVHPLNVLIGSQEDGAPPIFLIPPDADLESIRGGPDVTFEALMPRPGNYRMWVQMRRHDTVQLFVLTFNVIATD